MTSPDPEAAHPAAAEQPEEHSRERPMKPKRRVISVRWDRAQGLWIVLGRPFDRPYFLRKQDAIRSARDAAKDHVAAGGGLAQVRVFTKWGRIAFEHTYPRSSDPRRFAARPVRNARARR